MRQAGRVFVLLALLAGTSPLAAEPAGSLNVRQLGAVGDGQHDDTAAINQAMMLTGGLDKAHPFYARPLYFPDGTYLVSGILEKRDEEGQFEPGLAIIGQSTDKTVIRLKDNAPGYGDRNRPLPVIRFTSGLLGGQPNAGGKNYVGTGEGNDAYQNYLIGMTVDLGAGNPGAIGVDYLASNVGAIRDVRVHGGAGSGRIGISAVRRWIGPALLRNVRVEDVDIGIDVANSEYGITLAEVSVSGAREVALRNAGNVISFLDLGLAAASGRVLESTLPGGLVVGRRLKLPDGGKIANQGVLQLQDSQAGAAASLNDQPAPKLDGIYQAGQRTGESGFRLPARLVPTLPESGLVWRSVTEFGARPDPKFDSSEAIAAAFRSGATAIAFPSGIYMAKGPVAVPATVMVIDGNFSEVRVNGQVNPAEPAEGFFRPDVRTSPLFVRRLAFTRRGGSGRVVGVDFRNPGALAIQDSVGFAMGIVERTPSGGELFLENIGSARIRLSGAANAWFFQWNSELMGIPAITTTDARLAIYGIKTEQQQTLLDAGRGSTTEIVGGLAYMVKRTGADVPFIQAADARVLATYAEEVLTEDAFYRTHLAARTGDRTTTIAASDLPMRGKFGRFAIGIEAR